MNAPRQPSARTTRAVRKILQAGEESDRALPASQLLSPPCLIPPFRSNSAPRAAGPVAQWLEPAAHNGLVAGSSPARPTVEFLYY